MRRAVIDGRDSTVVAAMVFEAATLVVVSAVHLVTAGGSKPRGAGIAEAVIAVVLLAGASALARGGPHGHQAALGALAVAIAGFILGLTFTLRGGTLADVLPPDDAAGARRDRGCAAPWRRTTGRATLTAMGIGGHFAIFLGVAALVIITPGPDMAIVTKNAVIHGRRAALGTSFGVVTGLAIWTVASALGVASLVRASAIAFTVLKLIGAAYLIWLGVQALLAARRAAAAAELDGDGGARGPRTVLSGRIGFRQGLFSNLANPKIAVFFTSLLPQFIASRHAVLAPFLVLGGLFVLMTLIWLSGYAILAVRASAVLQRPRVKAGLDRLSGVVLIGLGVRLATERP